MNHAMITTQRMNDMTENVTDEVLVRRAQSDDKEAFFALYDRYFKKVYNRVRSKVPPQDVEDVTQEVFIALLRSLHSFKEEARFNTWLYTIVNRHIADFYRRRNRRSSPNEAEVDLESGMNVASAFDSNVIDQRLLVQGALNRVPEHYQEIVLMRFADGLSFSEIAEQRHQSLEAIKSLYRRAIQAIRGALDEPQEL